MPHPMHLHGFGFRVLRRQGTYGEARRLATEPGGRLATDLGVKDTVGLWPNETLWLAMGFTRSGEHTSELQSQSNLGCRLLLEKKNKVAHTHTARMLRA